MKALFEGGCAHTGRALDPGIYTGTSVGSLNAAVMAAPQEGESSSGTLERLEDLWCQEIAARPESCGNGVFRLRGDLLPYLNPRCLSKNPLKPLTRLVTDSAYLTAEAWERMTYFVRHDASLLERLLELPDISGIIDTTPMDDLMRRHVDLERLRRSKKELSVVATDWQRARPRVFGKQEILDLGYKVVLASASIPAVFPPVDLDGGVFVDGGVLLNTPLKPAIRMWKKRSARTELTLHAIYLDAELADIPIETTPSTFGTTNRLVQIILGRNVNTDIEYATTVNDRVRRARAEAGKTGAGAGSKARKPVASGKRLITIHRYRPSTDLGGVLGLLDFSLDRIDRLIRKGYDDAIRHDCGVEGCVLPD